VGKEWRFLICRKNELHKFKVQGRRIVALEIVRTQLRDVKLQISLLHAFFRSEVRVQPHLPQDLDCIFLVPIELNETIQDFLGGILLLS
jgi:hypothetical protein